MTVGDQRAVVMHRTIARRCILAAVLSATTLLAACSLPAPRLTSIGVKNAGTRDLRAVTMMYPRFVFRFGELPPRIYKTYGPPRFPGGAEVRIEWEDAGTPRCALVTLKLPLPQKKWRQDYHLLLFLHDTEPPTAGLNIWDPNGPLNYEFINITATTRFTPCLGLTWKYDPWRDDPNALYPTAEAASP